MPPKKKSNKDDNDILTRIAIVNADRSVVAGKQNACIAQESVNSDPFQALIQVQAEEMQTRVQEKLSCCKDRLVIKRDMCLPVCYCTATKSSSCLQASSVLRLRLPVRCPGLVRNYVLVVVFVSR